MRGQSLPGSASRQLCHAEIRTPAHQAARHSGTLLSSDTGGGLDGCRADVSFIAGMIVDKFAYHQPLYRQHVKLQDVGINVIRA